MPIPAKPCTGQFNEEVIAALEHNVDRAQWLSHPCGLCGQPVGARLEKGKWVPDQHWPSVQYKERTRTEKRQTQRSKSAVLSTS